MAAVDTVKISAYLKEKRLHNALTQQNVADRLGLTPQAVSKWERGESMPDITLLPVIAKMYGIGVEDILSAGAPQEVAVEDIMRVLNQFVDEALFQKILRVFRNATDAQEIGIPSDVFMALNTEQKDILLEFIPRMENNSDMTDQILPYLNAAQRGRLTKCAAENGDYALLETLLPFVSRDVRTDIVMLLLERGEFGVLEEVILFLNRVQKNIIIAFFAANQLDGELLDSFMPFFDKEQRKAAEQFMNGGK